MRETNLVGWTFGFDRATRRAGQCNYTHRKITVSRRLMALYSEAEAKDTVIHEVAHALVGPGEAHGERWRETAIALGGTGEVRVSRDAPQLPPKYVGLCSCGREFARMRLPRADLMCRACAEAGYDATITWFHWAS